MVFIDVLAEVVAPWHDEWCVALAVGTEDAADASVGDDGVRFAEAFDHLVEGKIGIGASDAGRRCAGAILDHQLTGAERAERAEKPLERLVVGADGDEDQSTPPAYSARSKRSATAGHWTKKRSASG